MKNTKTASAKRWETILKAYEKIKPKSSSCPFKLVQDFCAARRITRKELMRNYRKWMSGNRKLKALFPAKRKPQRITRGADTDLELNDPIRYVSLFK